MNDNEARDKLALEAFPPVINYLNEGEFDAAKGHRLAFAAGWDVRGQITPDRETIARIIAYSASDWTHPESQCDGDDHAYGHTNWEAYIEEAETILDLFNKKGN